MCSDFSLKFFILVAFCSSPPLPTYYFLLQASELDDMCAEVYPPSSLSSSSASRGGGKGGKAAAAKQNNTNLESIHYFGSWFLEVVLRVMTRYLWIGFPLDLYRSHEFSAIYWYVYVRQVACHLQLFCSFVFFSSLFAFCFALCCSLLLFQLFLTAVNVSILFLIFAFTHLPPSSSLFVV